MNAIRITATVLSVIILGVLGLETASHWWGRLLAGGATRDGPAASADRVAPPGAGTRSEDAARGHAQPRHRGRIHGTKADDVLEGSDSSERIEAAAGSDRIVAGGGDDLLAGETGDDVLFGGAGNDTYMVWHHGDGADILLEEAGTDTLQRVGGRITLAEVELLRQGEDLLIRWARDRPGDAVLIRSWFAGSRYRIERLQLPDGTAAPLDTLAMRARSASAADLVHFAIGHAQ